jgi:hypothetical protein
VTKHSTCGHLFHGTTGRAATHSRYSSALAFWTLPDAPAPALQT